MMIDSPSTSFVTACLFFSSLILPLALVYRVWLFYRRQKTITTRTTIPEVTANTCLKRLNEVPVIENNAIGGTTALITSVQYTAKDNGKKPMNISRPYAGEDAFFSYTPNQSFCSKLIGAMGIADGVGGYSDIGVDAGLMAWQLMENSHVNFKSSVEENNTTCFKSPREILCRSFDAISQHQQVACGGTTACLVSVFKDEDGAMYLQYANLGDSGFMVVRDGEVVFRTIDQTHYFNAPYQLAIPPKGRTVIMNSPLEANQFNEQCLQVREGDYIILATDGLWDNVFDEDVVQVLSNNINKFTEKVDIVDQTTRELLQKTHAISKNSPRPVLTPFQRYANDNKKNWIGGKIDDISVMIGCIIST